MQSTTQITQSIPSANSEIDNLIRDILNFDSPVHNYQHCDNEDCHYIEDDIQHRFISLIAKNKLRPGKARYIARLIKKHVLEIEYARWYA